MLGEGYKGSCMGAFKDEWAGITGDGHSGFAEVLRSNFFARFFRPIFFPCRAAKAFNVSVCQPTGADLRTISFFYPSGFAARPIIEKGGEAGIH